MVSQFCKGQVTKKITGGKTKLAYITEGKDLFTLLLEKVMII
jgi:hypothetical protein